LSDEKFEEGIIGDYFEIINNVRKLLRKLEEDSSLKPKIDEATTALSTVQWNCFIDFANNPQKTGAVTFKVRTPEVKLNNCKVILNQIQLYINSQDIVVEIIKTNWKDFVKLITNLTAAITQHDDAHTLDEKSFKEGIVADFF
jgi:hypothetical protein